MTTVTTRLDWVDAAKGLGIILVVYGHVARGLFHAGMYTDEASYILIDQIIYSFHMPLFFFLSGLFFMSSFHKRGFSLVLNKVDTIFYAYIVWSLLQGLLEVVMSNYTNGNVNLNDVLALLWQPRAQFWFLYTLFFVFVLNVLLSMILKKTNLQSISVWALFLTSILLLVLKPYLPGSFVFQSVAAYNIYFCIGILFVHVLHDVKVDKAMMVTLFVAFISLEYLTYVSGLFSVDSMYVKLTIAVLGIFSIVAVCQQVRGGLNKVLSYIGIYSMEIYLMHIIFGSGLRVLLQKILHVNSLAFELTIITIISILLPILFVKISRSLNFNFLFKPPAILSVGKFSSKAG